MLVTPKYVLAGPRAPVIYFHLPAYRRLAEECSLMNDQSFQVWISDKGSEYLALVQVILPRNHCPTAHGSGSNVVHISNGRR